MMSSQKGRGRQLPDARMHREERRRKDDVPQAGACVAAPDASPVQCLVAL